MKIGSERPKFDDATGWFNGSAEEVENLIEGKATLVHFWSVSCGICKENLPKIEAWREEQKDNLQVVAVHMPRYEADTDLEAVREAIEKHRIGEPCAVDNLHKLKDAFQNEQGFVPAYYLFDAEGKLKSFAAGERGLGMLKAALERVVISGAAA